MGAKLLSWNLKKCSLSLYVSKQKLFRRGSKLYFYWSKLQIYFLFLTTESKKQHSSAMRKSPKKVQSTLNASPAEQFRPIKHASYYSPGFLLELRVSTFSLKCIFPPIISHLYMRAIYHLTLVFSFSCKFVAHEINILRNSSRFRGN